MFASRKKPGKARRVGQEDDGDESDLKIGSSRTEEGPDVVVKRPTTTSRPKQKSKLSLSFGPGEALTAEEDGSNESEIITPKRGGLSRQAIEKSALQRSWTPSSSSEHLPIIAGQTVDRPSYSQDYLNELRNSTPSTPKDLQSLSTSEDEKDLALDVAAKFGNVADVEDPSVIPSEAEIKEKKERRARLAKEQDFISLDDEGEDANQEISLLPRKQKPETRLVRDDEEFAEGFEEFVDDGRISLGKKAEREQKRRQRARMRDLIDEAEETSEEDDSEVERNAAYEAAQLRAGMDGLQKDDGNRRPARPKTPPKITPLPRLATGIQRLKSTLSSVEYNKMQLHKQLEDLRQEKAEIAVREVEIQKLLKEAGSNYEKLRAEATLDVGSKNGFDPITGLPQAQRGLESFGNASGD